MTRVESSWLRLGSAADRRSVIVQPRAPGALEIVSACRQAGFGIELIDTANVPGIRNRNRSVHEATQLVNGFAGEIRVHGCYLDIYVHSPDPAIQAASEARVMEDIRLAEAIGAKSVVFHTNHLPCTTSPSYTDSWLDANAEFWNRVSKMTEVSILLENMWDSTPRLLEELCRRCPSIGVVLDIAHAHVFSSTPIAEWISTLRDRISYFHLGDNDGTADQNLALGDGSIPWRAFSDTASELTPSIGAMIGVGGSDGLDPLIRSVEFLAANRIYPYIG